MSDLSKRHELNIEHAAANENLAVAHDFESEVKNTPKESLQTNEWVEVTSKSPLELANELGSAMGQEARGQGYYPRIFLKDTRPSSVVKRAMQKLFINGLKDSSQLDRTGNFRFRLIDTPPVAFKTEMTVLAIAFEIEIELEPRYQKDGRKGQYQLRFFIKANLVKKPDEGGVVEISTREDPSFNSKAKRNIQTRVAQVRIASEVVWEKLIREGLHNTISGGLPGLGKKK